MMRYLKDNYGLINGKDDWFDYSLSNNNMDEEFVMKLFEGLDVAKLAQLVSSYPDYEYKELTDIIKQEYQVDHIALGAGSEDLIIRLNRYFSLGNKKVGVVSPIFYRIKETLKRYQSIRLPFKMDKTQPDISKLASCLNKFDIIWLSNPNPMNGKIIDRNDLLDLARNFKKVLFIVDEAAIDFIEEHSVIDKVRSTNNMIVVRSFSKFFSLAGMRAGFIAGNYKVLREIKMNGPTFPINNMVDYFIKVILSKKGEKEMIKKKILKNKNRIEKLIERNKNIVLNSSATNCIFFKIIGVPNLYKELLKKGVVSLNLNNVEGFTRKGFVRITVDSCERRFSQLYKKLNQFLKKYEK